MLLRGTPAAAMVAVTMMVFIVLGGSAPFAAAQSMNSSFTLTQDQGIHFLMYAYAAYCSEANLQNWTCKYCGPNNADLVVTNFLVDKSHNLFGYVGYDTEQEAIFVVFRGTEESSLKNWILDLKAGHEPIDDPSLPGAKVEEGFYQGWNALRNQTLNAVAAVLELPFTQSYRIICTGHSLGGALTVGAAMTLARIYPTRDVALITFGQPRVGNTAFSTYMTKYVPNTIRFVNNRDIVPHLPMELEGYHHAPREEWIHKGNLVICSPTNGEDPQCSDSLDFTTSIDDHLDYFGVTLDESTTPPTAPYPGVCL